MEDQIWIFVTILTLGGILLSVQQLWKMRNLPVSVFLFLFESFTTLRPHKQLNCSPTNHRSDSSPAL